MAVRNQFFVEDGRLTPGTAPANQKMFQQVPEIPAGITSQLDI